METGAMKFQQLRIGQNFQYQGDFYVKSSPLVASHIETSQQKFIPRYASIAVTESFITPEDKISSRGLDSEQIRMAFDKFYDCYLDSLQKLQPLTEAQALEFFQNKLDKARQLFLNEFGLEDK